MAVAGDPKPDHIAESVRVRVRLVYEGEYDVPIGSDGYDGATDINACMEIDRQQFFNDDDMLYLQAVDAQAWGFGWKVVDPAHNDGSRRTSGPEDGSE